MGHWVWLLIFVCVFCEAGVVQQCTEAQAGVVQEGLSIKLHVPSCYTWFWSCLPLWTATCLKSVSFASLFFWLLHAQTPNKKNARHIAFTFSLFWTPHLEFTPTRPEALHNPISKNKAKNFFSFFFLSTFIPTNINSQFPHHKLYSWVVCVYVCVCVGVGWGGSHSKCLCNRMLTTFFSVIS